MARYKNSRDKDGGCSDDGYRAETLFMRTLKSLGDTPERVFNLEDQLSGIDVKSLMMGSVDVKAIRRVGRDGEPQEEFIWVEFKNIVGQDGWLYSKADYIAFERGDDFVIVKRSDLIPLCETLVDLNEKVQSSNKALYHAYSRRGRRDLISMIKMEDLFLIPHLLLEKP